MSVFSKLRGFLYRHRSKFVVSGIIITGSVLLTAYAQRKLREWQENEAKLILERTRKQQHFESTERTCNQTILSLSGTLHESLARLANADDLIAELRNNPEKKLELWENLKILVFTKASCFIYLQVMLVLTLRIQLNIIGGYLFKNPNSVHTDLQQKYLTLCHNLLDTGVQAMLKVVEQEITKIIGPMELKRQLKLKDLDNIFWAIQSTIATTEANPVENLRMYVVPDDAQNGNDLFENMIRDTADLLESDEVKSLANHCINRGFVFLNDCIAEYYTPNEKSSGAAGASGDFVLPTDVEIPIAKLIPIVNGLLSKNSFPDQHVQHLIENPKVKTLGANIYECFS